LKANDIKCENCFEHVYHRLPNNKQKEGFVCALKPEDGYKAKTNFCENPKEFKYFKGNNYE
jgi:hypothetical protein